MNIDDFVDFRVRIKNALLEELKQPEIWYYLSFADEEPKGFLGSVIIKAHGLTDATMKCNMLLINPGGEAIAYPITDAMIAEYKITTEQLEKVANRLLSKEEIKAVFPDAHTLGEEQEQLEREKLN